MKTNTSIVFTGDIGFDRYMDQKWEDENLFSPELLEFFHSADHVCLNVEGAVTDTNDAAGEFVHSMSAQVVKPFRAELTEKGDLRIKNLRYFTTLEDTDLYWTVEKNRKTPISDTKWIWRNTI